MATIPNGGLITETNANYYAGQQSFSVIAGVPSAPFTCTFNTDLTDSPIANYTITNNGILIADTNYSVVNNQITITSSLVLGNIVVQLNEVSIDNNYGSYEYISLDDVINNFTPKSLDGVYFNIKKKFKNENNILTINKLVIGSFNIKLNIPIKK